MQYSFEKDILMIGKVTKVRQNSGLIFIVGENKETFVGKESSTDYKVREGRTVAFFPGDYGKLPDGTKGSFRQALNIQRNPISVLMEDEKLREAITKYYEYYGDRKIRLFKVARNKKTGQFMLVVHFTDENDERLTSMMEFQNWKDGHYDVTEVEVCERECEDKLIEDFVNDRLFTDGGEEA